MDWNKLDQAISSLYGNEEGDDHQKRFRRIQEKHEEIYGTEPAGFFSAPGRTELSGNHTDHNRGKVLAASIQLDALSSAAPRTDMMGIFHSRGFPPVQVDLSCLDPVKEEEGTSVALLRGIAADFVNRGYRIGGFEAYAESRVLSGSGLSSSAALEVLLGSIFNGLYNRNQASPTELAMIGQYSENRFFGKPCGLMDQIACAYGGIVEIDFKNPAAPHISPLPFRFEDHGYTLMVIDTGGNHADLTPDYAAIPEEMKSVAVQLGHEVCRELTEGEVLANLDRIRMECGDRAVLRAVHFFRENRRVDRALLALKEDDMDGYLQLVRESGHSSFEHLQNCYPPSHPREQGIPLALALTEPFLEKKGACRVHGGGFAGTIQVYLPTEKVSEYIRHMEKFFGKNCVTPLKIRSQPAGQVL